MSETVNFNGTNYTVPSNRQAKGWGTSLTSYLVALGQNSLAKSGGNFTLTADANFGATYGLVAKYFKSLSSNIALSEIIRLANNEGIAFRNAANDGDLVLKADASDDLVYEGNRILDTTDILDEDDLVSDSATKVPTQQSVKAYADTGLSAKAPVSTTVTLGTDQTITGIKTLDKELGFKHITTPSNPSAGYMKIYPKSDGKFYSLDESGTEVDIGAGVSTATPTAAGIVTSFTPTIKSRVKSVSNDDYTILDTDGYDIFAFSTGATGRALDLPTAADNAGRVATAIKTDSGAGNLTIDGEGAETINGATTLVIQSQYGRAVLFCNGTAWFIISIEDTFTVAADGSFTSGNIYGSRSGNLVSIHTDSLGHGTSAAVSSASGLIPTSFRPSANSYNSYFYDEDHGLNCYVQSDGTFSVFYRNETGTVTRTSTLNATCSYAIT